MIPDFKPINPWGRKPTLPDGWKSPFRDPLTGQPIRLYRVHVDWRGESPSHPISPAMPMAIASDLEAKVKALIKSGHPFWSNPHIVPA